MRQLIYLCDTLKDENSLLKKQLSQKKVEVESLTSQIEELKIKYDNVKFARSLTSGSSEEKEQAKKRLSKLVRDVDKCITMLKG
ncbi:MAG: hypothetical protein LBR46_07875 [Prevotella sp.]|nr:hypothetical protein [Prevotella sp.]